MLVLQLLCKPGLVGLTWLKTVHLNPGEKSVLTLAWEYQCSSAASLTFFFPPLCFYIPDMQNPLCLIYMGFMLYVDLVYPGFLSPSGKLAVCACDF